MLQRPPANLAAFISTSNGLSAARARCHSSARPSCHHTCATRGFIICSWSVRRFSDGRGLWGSQRLPTYVYNHAARSYPPQQEADQLSGGENKLAQAHARTHLLVVSRPTLPDPSGGGRPVRPASTNLSRWRPLSAVDGRTLRSACAFYPFCQSHLGREASGWG